MNLGIYTRVALAGAVWWLGVSTPILISRDMAGEAETQKWVYESCLKTHYRDGDSDSTWCDKQFAPWTHQPPLNLPSRTIFALRWSLPWMAIGLAVYGLLIVTVRWILAGRQKI